MSNDNLEKVSEVIQKQLDKYNNLNLKGIEDLSDEQKEPLIKITVNNQKITRKDFGTVKKNRINTVLSLIKQTVKKYPQINTTFYININDWSPKDMGELPIFVMSAHEKTKNFVIPDYLFCRDYSKKSGRNKDQIPHNQIVLNHRGKVPFEKKINKCFFRAGTSKNKRIIQMFPNNNNVDAQWSRDNFISYEDMFTHKYVISHYMKWDSVYFFLKSDILTFMYIGFKTYLWYDLFLRENEHYLTFRDHDEFKKKYQEMEENPEKATKIIEDSSKICDQYFNIETAIDYLGILLLEYQKKINLKL